MSAKTQIFLTAALLGALYLISTGLKGFLVYLGAACVYAVLFWSVKYLSYPVATKRNTGDPECVSTSSGPGTASPKNPLDASGS